MYFVKAILNERGVIRMVENITNARDFQIFNNLLQITDMETLEFYSNKITRKKICDILNVSDATIMRSITNLTNMGALKKITRGYYKFNPDYIQTK